MFIKYPHLLTRLGKGDNVHDVENVVCLLYGIGEKVVKDIDNASYSLFVKTKRDV